MTEGMCFWERLCISAGGQLVHDGRNNPGELQQKLGVTETNLYTKKYRLYMDGKPINTWVTFIYDERELWDVRVSYKEGKVKGNMTLERRVDATKRQDSGNGDKGRRQAARRQGEQDAIGKAGQDDAGADARPSEWDGEHTRQLAEGRWPTI
jgi:hypothetical protein